MTESADNIPVTVDRPFVSAVKPLVDAMGAELLGPEQAQPDDVVLAWEGQDVIAVRLPQLSDSLDHILAAVAEPFKRGITPDLRYVLLQQHRERVRRAPQQGETTSYAYQRTAIGQALPDPGTGELMRESTTLATTISGRGRPLELPWLSGAVARLGKEGGVATPTHQFITAVLTPFAGGHR